MAITWKPETRGGTVTHLRGYEGDALRYSITVGQRGEDGRSGFVLARLHSSGSHWRHLGFFVSLNAAKDHAEQPRESNDD